MGADLKDVLYRRFWMALTAFFVTILAGALVVASVDAKQTHLLQGAFGGLAQPSFTFANSLAVDSATGGLLVIDAKAQTVSRFNPDGTPDNFSALGTNVIDAKGSGQCATVPADCDQTPQNAFNFGEFAGSQQITVDRSGTATDGNIYVTQGLQAAGNLVDIFAADGKYIGQITAAGATPFGTAGSFPFSPCGVVVDGGGNLFVAGGYDNKIYKFDPGANPPVNADLVATFPTSEPVCNLAMGSGPSAGALFVNTFFTFQGNSVLKLDSSSGALQYVVEPGKEGLGKENRLVSVDPVSGNLFVFDESGEIKEYDASGASATLLSSTQAGNVRGLAVNGPALYAATPSSVVPLPLKVYGPLVTIPDVTTDPAAITGDTSARLNGTVDPDGVPLEECRFEYGLTTAYGSSLPCAETVGEIGVAPKAVHADISGLATESLYHYRLVAKNVNAPVQGADKTFRTPGKPSILSLGSLNVGRDKADLIATISPENSPTTYHFEWGTDTSYPNSTPELEVGSDEAGHAVSQALSGLTPGLVYHYRLVAANGIGTTTSSDHAFITYPDALAAPPCPNDAFRTGASATLPNCRAYEMVSPIDKNGGDIKVIVNNRGFPARLDQSSPAGERFTYSSVQAFADPESAPFVSQFMASRDPAQGWSSAAINPPRESLSLVNGAYKFDTQYKLFSEDLSEGWLFQDANPALDPCAPEGFINLYRRDSLTGDYEALIPNAPLNVPDSDYRLEVQGVSADGSRAVFRANAKLTSDAAGGHEYQLYEHIRGEGCGELRLISKTVTGNASGENASVGSPSGPAEYHESTVAQAVSSDGSRAFFGLGASANAPGSLYLRVNADQPQSPISAGKCSQPDKGCTLKVSSSTARFWTAASDGSVGIYSEGGSLFEYDTAKALAGEAASAAIAGAAKGVVAASEDASRIYLISEEQIEGEGVGGKPNLYLYERGKSAGQRYRLVATVDPRDLVSFQHHGFGLGLPEPIRNGVRATADGSTLAFVSIASLTGYDNTDAVDGRPDLEVFLYDEGAEELLCVSCNPSGAQPQGREFGPENSVIRRVAAMMAPGETQDFAPRALSADGNRLLFESFESLLPRDVNKKEDVYQWERAASAAECTATGAELYVPSAGGCLSLISSGQDEVDSELADASPDGSDVFIRTLSSLLPQDPGQIDVYDVREGGGFPIPPLPKDGCEGEACVSAPPPPPPETGIATQGPSTGNVASKKPCPKGKVRKGGKCVPKPKKNGAKKAKKKAGSKKKGARR